MEIKELGHVVLYVTNLEKLADFYKKTLGFKEIVRQWPMAVFSSGRTHHELLLIEVGGEKKYNPLPTPGRYHIGFKIGNTDNELREAKTKLEQEDVKIIGVSDHTVTHSLYIADPDGNELELYVDINDGWKKDPKLVISPTEYLDL